MRRDGASWTEHSPGLGRVYGLWGDPTGVLFAACRDAVWRWDGQQGRSAQLPDRRLPYAISGSGVDDVWVVGFGGSIWHWNGASWSRVESPVTDNLYGVWAASPTDAWAVGAKGLSQHSGLLHWDGTAWQLQESLPHSGGSLDVVWGLAADDVWVGGGFSLCHWDGAAWACDFASTLRFGEVTAVRGLRPDDLWAVADDGNASHFDGERWRPVDSCLPPRLEDLWPTTSGDVYVAGESGLQRLHR